MPDAAFWGFVGASALMLGAEVAFRFDLSRMTIGLIMAFGVGAIISAVSFELIVPAMESAEGWLVSLSLLVGAVVFFLGDRAVSNMGGSKRKNPDAQEEGGGDSGMGIALGSVLDGIPESAVLGMSLVGGAVSPALLASIWLSNFPESLGSSVNMVKSGRSKTWVRVLWLSIAGVSAISAAIGFAIVNNSDARTGAVVQAFAAGALLAMIVDEMAPEAFGKSRLFTGLATSAGFVLALFLTSLE